MKVEEHNNKKYNCVADQAILNICSYVKRQGVKGKRTKGEGSSRGIRVQRTRVLVHKNTHYVTTSHQTM